MKAIVVILILCTFCLDCSDETTISDAASIEFSDPQSDFVSSEVRDVDGQIVEFDANTDELIWLSTGQRFSGWPVDKNQIAEQFLVRFGTEDGERRAYFTEISPPTICNIEVNNGSLSISSTSVTVPVL
ncbi:MAG: hypothetical protein IPJ88_15535 [Myxococcales bacterium]|nr:MAG: hypothetical protein IPJ88_15535 [Myxococcales bacterium]